MKTAIVGCLVLLVGGCGRASPRIPVDTSVPDAGTDGPGDAAPRAFPADEISGARMHPRYWLVEDGMHVPQVWVPGQVAAWFDAQLAMPCTWIPWTGASYVCAPLVSSYVVSDTLFLDAECKNPTRFARASYYAWVQQAATPPSRSGLLPSMPTASYDELGRETACADKPYAWDGNEALELGDELAVSEIYDSDQGCGAIPLIQGEILRSVVRKVATSELATAHVERTDTGHRLSTRQLVSDDGARQRIGWYDNVLGTDCSVGTAADGKARCLPEGADGGQLFFFFTDATGAPLALVSSPDAHYDSGTLLRVKEAKFTCGQEDKTTVYRVGEIYTGDIYSAGDPTPIPSNGKPGGIYLHVTEVPAESMDAFEPKTVGGRLQIDAREDAEGALDVYPFGAAAFGIDSYRFPENLTDTTMHQPCRFQDTSDNTVHCVPDWSQQTGISNCSRNIVAQLKPPCPGDPSAAFTAVWGGTACAGGYQLSQFGAMISGRVGDCTVGGGDLITFYEIGAPAPPATFAAATLHAD